MVILPIYPYELLEMSVRSDAYAALQVRDWSLLISMPTNYDFERSYLNRYAVIGSFHVASLSSSFLPTLQIRILRSAHEPPWSSFPSLSSPSSLFDSRRTRLLLRCLIRTLTSNLVDGAQRTLPI